MSKLSHNDNPTAEDCFRQQNFVKCIADIIRNCDPPKGIAINGYWGCGKTSALLQIHKELTGTLPHEKNTNEKTDIIPIWFEAWRYQNDSQPIIALLHEIRAQIGIWRKVTDSAQKLSRIALDSVFDMVGKNFDIPGLDKINGAAQRYETQNRETPLPSQELRELLELAISKVLSKKKDDKKRLVIFIDDLDRCMPKTALQLLEGIKVYLNLKNCVLVFAMDQRQIEHALQEANIKHPHEYLEKICQDIHHLPLPNHHSKSMYLLRLLKQFLSSEEEQKYLTGLDQTLRLYDCLPANPRKIKALSNRIALMLRTENCKKYLDNFKLGQLRCYAILIAMACIYTFYRHINEQLEKDPNYINEVIGFAKSPDVDNSIYEPMKNLIPPIQGDKTIPVNPSDTNVFRIQKLLIELNSISTEEIRPFIIRSQ